MSFSSLAKDEVLKHNIENDCCQLAFLCAVIKSCGELSISSGEKKLVIVVDDKAVVDKISRIILNLYGKECGYKIINDLYLNKKDYYEIYLPADISFEILQDAGVINANDPESSFLTTNVPNFITSSECCTKAFFQGVFVSCATSSIKLSEKASEKTTSGYHLEFTSHNYNFLQDVANLLANYNITPKIVERKNIYVLYLKEANQICDVLCLIGAINANLALQNEIIAREMRNQVNRETNCFSANVAKTMSASAEQLKAIEIIRQTIGIESLEPELQDVVLLRLANQEESLDELLKLSTIKLTKSGLYHRFKKILKIAESLK